MPQQSMSSIAFNIFAKIENKIPNDLILIYFTVVFSKFSQLIVSTVLSLTYIAYMLIANVSYNNNKSLYSRPTQHMIDIGDESNWIRINHHIGVSIDVNAFAPRCDCIWMTMKRKIRIKSQVNGKIMAFFTWKFDRKTRNENPYINIWFVVTFILFQTFTRNKNVHHSVVREQQFSSFNTEYYNIIPRI